MKTVRVFPFETIEYPDMAIVMPDGCRLSARVWMPKNARDQPVPAILEYLPYRKRDGTAERDALTHAYFAGHGYACLRVDMRGNGDSEGLMEDEYTEQELQDACDVIAWIIQQPWCSGKLGMMGISWGGFNALQVAAMQPPGLDAIITLCSTDDRFADDIHYKGGCLLNENLGWGATMLSYSSRPPDPEIAGEKWRDMWLERLENMPFYPALWLEHQMRDTYWKHGSVCEDYSKIKAATLVVGGWGDAYKNAVSRLVQGIQAPVKGIIGPWIHKYPHFAVPLPRIGFLQEALRWWDRWLKGLDTGVEEDPAMRLYLMESLAPKQWHDKRPGRWLGFRQWPAPEISTQTVYLAPGAALSETKPLNPLNILVKSPSSCGGASGEYCAIWLGPEMPGEQAEDDAMSACFDTAALAEPLDIIGAPTVRLRLSASTARAQLAIRLCDLRPDGACARITYGVLNLCHRDSHEHPALIDPGTPFEVRLQLDDVAYCVPAGHKLRLAVSSAYWPLIWPAPMDAELEIQDGAVSMPVLTAQTAQDVRFEAPEAAVEWSRHILRAPSNRRDSYVDADTGESVLDIADDFGEVEDTGHGLRSGGMGRETWRIHPDDPLSAQGRTHWTETLARAAWNIRTETFTSMTSTAENFQLTARIEAYEDGRLVFARDCAQTIARNYL